MKRRTFIKTLLGGIVAASLVTLLLVREYEYCEEMKRLMDAMDILPEREVLIATDISIREMKTSGFWDTLECFYNLEANTKHNAHINWINPN